MLPWRCHLEAVQYKIPPGCILGGIFCVFNAMLWLSLQSYKKAKFAATLAVLPETSRKTLKGLSELLLKEQRVPSLQQCANRTFPVARLWQRRRDAARSACNPAVEATPARMPALVGRITCPCPLTPARELDRLRSRGGSPWLVFAYFLPVRK